MIDTNMQNQMTRLQDAVQTALSLATAKGASAEASITQVQGISVSCRMGEVENIEFNNDAGLGIAVYKGHQKGTASTADLSPDAIALTVQKALDIANYTSADEFNGLADQDLMASEQIDCDLYHPSELDTDQALAMALEIEQTALAVDARLTNSDGASVNANRGCRVYGNTHGFMGAYPSTRYSASCVLIAEQDDDMQRDFAFTVDRRLDRLTGAKQLGLDAAQHTLSRLQPQKVPTGKYPVIFDKTIAGSLFGHFTGAISGGNLYRKATFLLDHLGQQIFPEWLTIEERPHLRAALASTPFDHEGLATRDQTIIANGHLQTYLLASYAARKLGMQATGHAGGAHNWQLSVAQPQPTQADLLKQMGTGLLVTELMGSGVNMVTGDYSRGAGGFWVENGVIQYPVSEITIAGNLKDMLRNIVAIADDVETRGSVFTGSVLLPEMSVAGS